MNERRLRLKGKVAIVTGAGSRGEGVGNGKANLSETLPFNPQVVGSIPTGPTKLDFISAALGSKCLNSVGLTPMLTPTDSTSHSKWRLIRVTEPLRDDQR